MFSSVLVCVKSLGPRLSRYFSTFERIHVLQSFKACQWSGCDVLFIDLLIYLNQCILTSLYHHIVIVIVTIIKITQHTIELWAVKSLRPSVIMAAADLHDKLKCIIL